ncbi:MAG TPA: hypothetical protein VI197_33915 [Polyangiaceae bacterium]
MAKILTCPACGAPLELDDDDDGVIECLYCQRHVVVATGAPTEAVAKKVVASPGAARETRRASGRAKKQAPRAKKPAPAMLAVAIGLPLLLAVVVFFTVGPGLGALGAAEEPPPSVDQQLGKLSLDADQERVAAAFGMKPNSDVIPNRLTIDARGPGRVRRAELSWTASDKGHISRVNLSFQPSHKPQELLQKVTALVPNRLRPGAVARVSQGDAVLDISSHGLTIWHWDSLHPPGADSASCALRLGALWSVARAAALDGAAPTPAQLELVNGPKLEAAAAFELEVPVEQAVERFQKRFSAGWCRMQAGLMCVVDVDDKLVDSVRYTWPNGLRARVAQARLELRTAKATDAALRAVAGCLEPVLGKGEEQVVDYVRGTRNWRWKLAPEGDEALLAGPTFVLTSAEGKPLDQPAGWHAKLGKVAAAVTACGW